jgi:hypothetical protein
LRPGILGGDLRGVRGRLAAALEAHHAGRDHAIALPCASVMVIMVLLKLAFTWADAAEMFLRSRPPKALGSRA